MKKDAKSKGDDPPTRISDPRFASFETDPRFRLPSKKKTKTIIDKRFSRMFKDDEFTAATRVDRYGRKIKSDAKKKALQRLYQVEDEDGDEEDEEEDDKNAGEGSADKQEDEEEIEVEDDDVVQRELLAAHEKYDPARGGGFSSSESDSDSDSDSDDEEDGGAEVAVGGELQRLQDEQAEVEAGEVTNRIAIVNLDWDHVKSTDLFALFSSFLPADGGKIEKVSVYPSEFGKERMRQEEAEGPPKALFKGKKKQEDSDSDSSSDDDDDSEDGDEKIKKELMQEGNDEDFDSDALRAYQLDRLRYYYAVMVCSSPATAKKLYDSTDGTEFQSSSNFLDLRFVPDDVTFDDEPRDDCDSLPTSYRPVEFVTNALQSSKVKLTWDMHPEETSRKDSIKRAFTGSRQQLEENDLRAYLASDSEDDGSDDDDDNGVSGEQDEDAPKLSKKELARKRMREALGLTDEAASKAPNKGHVGDMEITFTPALTESKPKDDDKEETTIEKYKRKERERKEMKRQKARAKREGLDPDALDEEEKDVVVEKGPVDQEEDLGFDDPFFTAADDAAPKSKSAVRKEERLKKRQAREAAEAEASEQKAHLSKVMTEDANEDQAEHLDHFDMNDIVRAEKLKGKKGKAKKRAAAKEDGGKLQEGFVMDVNDERFKAVFENHEFAIDPSNPKFKPTEGMKQLLEETRKRRRGGDPAEERVSSKKSKKARK